MDFATREVGPAHKGYHRCISDVVTFVMHSGGAVLTLCLVAEILGRLQRFCTHAGRDVREVNDAV